MQLADFADCIGTCTGNDKIGSSQQVTKFFFDEFILYITGDIIQFLLRLAFSAKMNNLEIFQKFRKNLTDIVVYRSCAETAANNHNYWLVSSETTEFTTSVRISGKKFLTDRSSGKNCFVSRKIIDSFREVTAYF